jgi:cyclase
MLTPRIIPCLLLHKKGLVKSKQFSNYKYIGDPLNAVKIFNEKKVDELIFLDIDATKENREPDYKLIERIAFECRMPLCYGGGIKSPEIAKKIFNLGVEKVAISSIALQNHKIIREIANQVGNQSVVVVLDIKKKLFGGYEIYSHNGQRKHNLDLLEFIELIQDLGAGELVINSIDHDGMLNGFDVKLLNFIRDKVNIPLTLIGGASSLQDFGKVIEQQGIIGLAAGSFFVLKGKYQAVLINYPTEIEKKELLDINFYANWLNK